MNSSGRPWPAVPRFGPAPAPFCSIRVEDHAPCFPDPGTGEASKQTGRARPADVADGDRVVEVDWAAGVRTAPVCRSALANGPVFDHHQPSATASRATCQRIEQPKRRQVAGPLRRRSTCAVPSFDRGGSSGRRRESSVASARVLYIRIRGMVRRPTGPAGRSVRLADSPPRQLAIHDSGSRPPANQPLHTVPRSGAAHRWATPKQ